MIRAFLLLVFTVMLLGCQKPPVQQEATTATIESPVSSVPAEPAPASPIPVHVDLKALETFPTNRPADAVSFGGRWYKAFESGICWHTAKAACERMGGHLACIETAAEQQFITKLADGRYLYLGATDEAMEEKWRWVNNAPWDYTCWMDGQPNNYGADEHYLATYDGGDWVDVADEGSGFWMPIGFICEWPQ